MRNKFLTFLFLIVFPLILLNSSCEKSGAAGIFVITSGKGTIFYDGLAVTYDLSFQWTVSNQSDVPGTVIDWKIVYKFGSNELGENIREITSENCSSFNIEQLTGLRIDSHEEMTMAGRTVPPIDRNIRYFSRIPDNMDISVTILDDHSNTSTIRFNAVVTFSEDIGP